MHGAWADLDCRAGVALVPRVEDYTMEQQVALEDPVEIDTTRMELVELDDHLGRARGIREPWWTKNLGVA